ncbi:MAG: HD domain-containing phosphohydrolase [Desulfotignum sp.]|jgi:HD-GYP domain-containing protein (c-di-GMP phosphodiesterase class II)|nr:HD domain-containing phosphohydrolase [Desulfotignum sp.]
MDTAGEYFDDGSSFVPIDPLSINPDSLADFALFERNDTSTDGKYRFRCLLKDSSSIPRQRLLDLLRAWDIVYIHKKQRTKYTEYVRNNLEFILKHDEIDVKKKTDTLIGLSTEVVQEAFQSNFASHQACHNMVENIRHLIARAIDYISSIASLGGIAELVGHDYETHTHSIKVGWLMATFINFNQDLFPVSTKPALKEFMIQAAVAGFLHDIGKVKIPKNVINKPGKLNNLEYVIIQSHTAYSTSLLFETKLPRSFMQMILYHHENEDGSGYPRELGKDQIPVLAKVCHIIDVFDALTSRRPYKPAKSPFEALKIMAGDNPYLEKLQKFETEARENKRVPVTAIVRDDYQAKLRRLREKEMLEEEAQKRVEARMRLRDQGMSHCFNKDLLRRFILTINSSDSFDLSGLL